LALDDDEEQSILHSDHFNPKKRILASNERRGGWVGPIARLKVLEIKI